jgi:pimeloyl-ACP methyl ester carboxylesterase
MIQFKKQVFGGLIMKKYIYGFLFLFVVAAVLINLNADKIIFYPEAEHWPITLPFEEVSFDTTDGERVSAIYLPPADYMDTILFFHGNAGNVTYFEDWAEVYAKYGFGILIFDYRGFGKSPGKISERKIYDDSSAAAEYLMKEKHTPPSNIVLFGYSFGNAPAIKTAVKFKDTPFKALILQSPFTNTPQMGAALLGGGYNPSSGLQKTVIGALHVFLFDKKYDNLSRIKKVTIPMLIGYNRQDNVIPWEMSHVLADAAPEGTKQFLSSTGKHTGFTWFEKEAVDFINSLPN